MNRLKVVYIVLLVICGFSINGVGQNLSVNYPVKWVNDGEFGLVPEKGFSDQNGVWSIGVSEAVDRKFDVSKGEISLLSKSGAVLSTFALNQDFTIRSSKGKHYLLGSVPAYVNGKPVYSVRVKASGTDRSSLKAGPVFPNVSQLADGDWFKLRIPARGVYRVTHALLKSMGVDVSGDVANFGIFGNGRGMLSFDNSEDRPGGLTELATYQKGLEDGSFDPGDYMVFADPGQQQWRYQSAGQLFLPNFGLYDDYNYVFFSPNKGSLRKVQDAAPVGEPNNESSYFDEYAQYNQDLVNLVESGRNFYGELFDFTTEYRFTFNYAEKDPSEPIRWEIDFAARTLGNDASTMEFYINNALLGTKSVPGIGSSQYREANRVSFFENYEPNQEAGAIALDMKFIKNSPSSRAWLDQIIMNYRRKLSYKGVVQFFRDKRNVGGGVVTKYNLENASGAVKVWRLDDYINPVNYPLTIDGSGATFSASAEVLSEYVVFNPGNVPEPEVVGKVENQNLHAVQVPDYLMIVPSQFTEQAEELAELHREDGLDVLIVDPLRIYDEFSSGSRDITGLRDFARMLYQRDPAKFKYLLLFGDGSYKNKDDKGTNVLPTYQSEKSEERTSSYVSDDFYALLDEDESDSPQDLMDIGVGRFPVNTVSEASSVVRKIKEYMGKGDHPEAVFGNWKSRVVFVADDFDGDGTPTETEHTTHSEVLAEMVEDSLNGHFISRKKYMAFYPQISTPGGERYPEGQRAVKESVDNGALIVNYTGHGGEVGWAHERILDIPTILNWRNAPQLPLFVTATCEFTRYDDPDRISAGEWAFLSGRGGGVGLLTTTRVVYSGANFTLNRAFFQEVFKKDSNNEFYRLGDIIVPVKIAASGSGINHRNFSLIGDPALRLTYPQGEVKLNSFSGASITQVPDTIKALGKVEFSGEVLDSEGNFDPNFNGEVQLVVFDKKDSILSLNNDNGTNTLGVNVRNSAIFKGRVTARNGKFDVSFVAPKDISFLYKNGLISCYAFDTESSKDALGSYKNVVIGGTSDYALNDDQNPNLSLSINDESFVEGGMTSENPILKASVSDDFGINTTGNGLGHDITAILDDDPNQIVVLNNYYQGDLDSSASGKIEYRYEGLKPGRHELKVKVWDVNNNSTEKTIEFVVNDFKDVTIDHVLNYPNPFTTNTGFYFEHNQAEKDLSIEIKIFSMNGRLVRVIKQDVIPTGFRYGPIPWDGKDEFGQPLGRGVYMYKLQVSNSIGATASKMEKLVLLK